MKPFVEVLTNLVYYNKLSYRRRITVLEIGVHKGVSTETFLKAIAHRKRHGRLYSIDIREPNYVPDESLAPYWELIKADSAKVSWRKRPLLDALVIDGAHDYNHVKRDYERFEPYVRFGGTILLHDIKNLKYDGYHFWPEIPYQKIVLDWGRNGMGVVIKGSAWG